MVELLDDTLDRLDAHNLVGGVEVLVGDRVDVGSGELAPRLLLLEGEPGASLAEALELADVVARDLGHVAQVVVGQLALLERDAVQN